MRRRPDDPPVELSLAMLAQLIAAIVAALALPLEALRRCWQERSSFRSSDRTVCIEPWRNALQTSKPSPRSQLQIDDAGGRTTAGLRPRKCRLFTPAGRSYLKRSTSIKSCALRSNCDHMMTVPSRTA